MSEEIQKLKFVVDTKSLDEANIKLQQEKEKVQELNKAIKELGKESGARKDLIIEKAQAEKNVKALQTQIKTLNTNIEGVSTSSTKSFKKMAFLILGVAGAGKGLVTFLRKLFKESEFFQKINFAVAEFGKSLSGLIDSALNPFVKGLKSAKDIEFEKSLKKIEDKAIDNIASFEMLAKQVENLGKKLNPTASEQIRYANAVQKLKEQYPEYLSLMSSEIKNHKENIVLLEYKRKMLFDDIKRKVVAEEMEVAIREQIKAERELALIKVDPNESGYGNIGMQIKAADNLKAAQEKVIEVEKRYNEELNKTVLAEAYLANAKTTAKLQATEAKIAKEQEIEAIRQATEEEEKYNKAIEKRDEELKARLQSALTIENADLRTIELQKQTALAIQDVIDKYEKLKVTAPDVAVTVGEQWQSILQGVGSFKDLTLEGWSEAANAISQTTGNLLDTFNNLYQVDINNAQNAANEKISILEDQYTRGLISQDTFERGKLALEKKAEKEVRKLKEKQRDMDAVKTAVSGIAASIDTFKNFGGWPFGVVPAAVMTGLWMSAVAQIKSQKFQEGGLAVGPSHSEGGIQGNVKGRPIEFEGGEIIAKKEVNEDPYTRDIVNYAQVLKKGRRIPNSRNVKGIMIDYGNRQHYLTGSGRGLPSLSSMTFAEGGSTGAISPTSSSVASPITVNIPQPKTELIPIMKGNDLFIKVTQMQNKYKNNGGNLEDIG